MKLTKFKKILFLTLLGFVGPFLKSASVFAANNVSSELSRQVQNIFNWGFSMAGGLAGTVIAFGAALWVFSSVRPSLKSEAKEWIKAGITGLVLLAASFLIINTINPGIFNFTGKQIKLNQLQGGGGAINPVFGPNIVTYNQIPLGMMVENLMAKQVPCYEFDMHGDPLYGDMILSQGGGKFPGPTYMSHDRVDCYLRLSEAAEKKALALENVAKEIQKLMETCVCTPDKCEDQCKGNFNRQTGEWDGCKNPSAGCVGACKQWQTAWCKTKSPLNPGSGDDSLACCSDDVKKKIQGDENFPIKLAYNKECPDGGCTDGIVLDYFGLKEFKARDKYSTFQAISSYVEAKRKVDKKDPNYTKDLEITYIKDLEKCETCMKNCQCAQGDSECLKKQPECLNEQAKCLVKRSLCIKNKDKNIPWGQLNLAEQLIYLQGKLEQLQGEFNKDKNTLSGGVSKVAQCPMIKSYIDLQQRDEQTDKEITLLKVNSSEPDAKKYCTGFNYANSQCYNQCSQMCPIQKKDISCFQECVNNTKCEEKNNEYKKCLEKITNNPALAVSMCDMFKKLYDQCLVKENECATKCYRERECKDNPDFPKFKDCMVGCNNNCQSLCKIKYLTCSDEFKACSQMCDNDSTCVGNNLNSCILNPQAIARCAGKSTEDEIKSCIESSYLCDSGSLQNSGYPECLKDPTKQDDFSSSYIWQNQDKLVCKDPYAKKSLDGYPFFRNGVATENCESAYPETARCLTGTTAKCPTCKCDSAEKNLTFNVESKIEVKEYDVCDPTSQYNKTRTCDPKELALKQFQVVGPECTEYASNDDPLIFYCRTDWWNEPETKRPSNIGKINKASNQMLKCERSEEIPVGNTVDDTMGWYNNFSENYVKKISEAMGKIINSMKKISTARDYCDCDSKYESGRPVCRTCCTYIPPTKTSKASCRLDPCNGHSCQAMINLFDELINSHSDLKTKNIDLYGFIVADKRSDPLKELTFSRNQTNKCSGSQADYGVGNTRMINCQRALEDIVSPIMDADKYFVIDKQKLYHYCYGTQAAAIYEVSSTTDNWFCCHMKKLPGLTPEEQKAKQKQLDERSMDFLPMF